jgi:hypothetical protein
MNCMVLADLKIVRCVVQRVLVPMVDFFASQHWASEHLFGHNDVLEHVALAVRAWMTLVKNFAIALLDDLASHVEATRAQTRAKLCHILSERRTQKRLTAVLALQGNGSGRLFRVGLNVGPEIVLAAESVSEVNGVTVVTTAQARGCRTLTLFRHGLSALPEAIAARRAEGVLHLFSRRMTIEGAAALVAYHIAILAQMTDCIT